VYEDLICTSDDSNDDDSAYAFHPDDLDDLRHAARFRSRTPAWSYSGDLMKCVLGAHEEEIGPVYLRMNASVVGCRSSEWMSRV
jgi:hypothetical protein